MKRDYLTINQRGTSVVEIVIAAAIFILIATSFLASLIFGTKSFSYAADKNQATLLAQEGLEAVRNIKDNSFDNLIDGSYGLLVSNGQFVLAGSTDQVEKFARQISILSLDQQTKQIDSRVSWLNSFNQVTEVALTIRLTNWAELIEMISSCNDFCLSLDYVGGVCRQNQAQCNRRQEIYQAEGDQYCLTGPAADTCCCQPDYD